MSFTTATIIQNIQATMNTQPVITYVNACTYELELPGHKIKYIGHHTNLNICDRLYAHRSGARHGKCCQSKYLFYAADDYKDVQIHILRTFKNITKSELKDEERADIITGGFYENKLYNARLPSSLPTKEFNKQCMAKKRKDPEYVKQETVKKKVYRSTDLGKAEYERKCQARRIKAFQTILDDDLTWFHTICKNAEYFFPLTDAEKWNRTRRYKKKWAMQKTQQPLARVHRIKEYNVDLTWFQHLMNNCNFIFPVSAEENANRKRRIKVDWTLTKKYGPEHCRHISKKRKQMYDARARNKK